MDVVMIWCGLPWKALNAEGGATRVEDASSAEKE